MTRPTPSPTPAVDLDQVRERAADVLGQLGGAFLFAVSVMALGFVLWWVIRHIQPDGYWVYEIDTDEGELLYVGSTDNPERRMRRHESFQRKLPDGHPRKWWQDAAEPVRRDYWPTRATWYNSKAVAQQVEKDRVRRKNPIANQIRYKGVTNAAD